MARVLTTQKNSIADQLERLHQRVERRAYELFRRRDGGGDSLGDWLSAERELVWKPAVELREQAGILTIIAALPDFESKDITVDITPRDIVIQTASENRQTEDTGQLHRSESTATEVFLSLPFPKAVDATKAKAEHQNGMLSIAVPIARPPEPSKSTSTPRVSNAFYPPALNGRPRASGQARAGSG